MGIPLPDDKNFEFLCLVFEDFVPSEIDSDLKYVPLIPNE